MALKKTVSINVSGQDVEFADAYIRVAHINASKHHANAQIDVMTAPDGNVIKRDNVSFEPTMDSNFITQAYQKMKTVPEYQGATDC